MESYSVFLILLKIYFSKTIISKNTEKVFDKYFIIGYANIKIKLT
ncbi:hypothetical protein HMPREF9171_0690 [Streptococcus agalactiae ATCC 13813]|nr:hypothetical protein SaSA30_1309 [Streptococcus agalactiae]EFV97771.1 hypothetical protein HMPREF9171_0690 [Streptococcus agalactiae ATCC 13813]AUO82385.1 hypothetical protein SaSA33_1307 [Streptococcus agalactiae]AUO85669.1 hypothetical protein SaSA73_1309 [Streptococcus agalactiae]AUO87309.1 hypothetical protein SaSA1_1311 [Streptococcus agalactiae]